MQTSAGTLRELLSFLMISKSYFVTSYPGLPYYICFIWLVELNINNNGFVHWLSSMILKKMHECSPLYEKVSSSVRLFQNPCPLCFNWIHSSRLTLYSLYNQFSYSQLQFHPLIFSHYVSHSVCVHCTLFKDGPSPLWRELEGVLYVLVITLPRVQHAKSYSYQLY